MHFKNSFIQCIKIVSKFNHASTFQVPGLNVPWKDAGYYILSLTFASIVHEAGHALAAARYASSKLTQFFLTV